MLLNLSHKEGVFMITKRLISLLLIVLPIQATLAGPVNKPNKNPIYTSQIHSFAKPTHNQTPTKPIVQNPNHSLIASWSVNASVGYTQYQDLISKDNNGALGRLALARAVHLNNQLKLGVELGVQNGKIARLKLPQETLDELGGLPIQATINPMLDILATAQINIPYTSHFFADLRGGAAYRQLEFNDRSTVDNITKIAGEIQAGMGYSISPNATLSLLYQGVFGGSIRFNINPDDGMGHVFNIPIQNDVLLTVNVAV